MAAISVRPLSNHYLQSTASLSELLIGQQHSKITKNPKWKLRTFTAFTTLIVKSEIIGTSKSSISNFISSLLLALNLIDSSCEYLVGSTLHTCMDRWKDR